jgi:hypothetical protein
MDFISRIASLSRHSTSALRRAALALVIVGGALPACAEQTPPATPPAPPGQIVCTAPRPQVCTRDYRPVCGIKADGTRQTYGNGCGACADANVLRHIPGPCS